MSESPQKLYSQDFYDEIELGSLQSAAVVVPRSAACTLALRAAALPAADATVRNAAASKQERAELQDSVRS